MIPDYISLSIASRWTGTRRALGWKRREACVARSFSRRRRSLRSGALAPSRPTITVRKPMANTGSNRVFVPCFPPCTTVLHPPVHSLLQKASQCCRKPHLCVLARAEIHICCHSARRMSFRACSLMMVAFGARASLSNQPGPLSISSLGSTGWHKVLVSWF